MKNSISKIIVGFGLLVINIGILYGQTQVTRYTPEGSSVRCYNQITEMSSAEKADLSAWVSYYYPQATQLNTPSASSTYNCHAYAWHIYQGGDNVWIGYYQGQEADEDVYWTDGSYIKQSSEAGASKISYYDGNHSAIQTSTQGIYKSKWGPGPLMQHARDYGPPEYSMSNRNYYARPVISGDGLLCYPSSHTYSVQDFVGVTYSWTTSSHLQINGSSTGSTVSVSPTSSSNMAEWVKVEITITAYSLTVETTKTVWVGAPEVNITGPDEGCTNTSHTFRAQPTNYLSNPTSYSYWGIDPNDGYISTSGNGEYAYITFYNEYSVAGYDIEVKGTNTCGTGSFGYGNIWIYDCYYYVMSPNPASDIVTISRVLASEDTKGKTLLTGSVDTYTTSEIQILDYYGSLHLQTTKSGDSFTIPVSNLKDGTYLIKITNGNKTSSLKMVVKH